MSRRASTTSPSCPRARRDQRVRAGGRRSGLLEGEGADPREGAGEVEAEGVARSGVGHRPAAAGAGVDGGAGAPSCGAARARADVGAGAAAGIGDAERRSVGERGGVARLVLGLPQHRLRPGEAEPGQVVVDGGLVLGAAAGGVDVFDAEEEGAARVCARSQAVSAEKAWPRCRGPVGEGAKRVRRVIAARRVRRASRDW